MDKTAGMDAAPMIVYEAIAYFDGTWWTFEIDELTSPSARDPGHRVVAMGQARKAADVRREAVDLAALWTGGDRENIEVVVRYRDFGEQFSDVDLAHTLEAQGRVLMDEASRLRRSVVGKLRASGLSQADAATILGISRQCVQQLENSRTKGVSALSHERAMPGTGISHVEGVDAR